MKAEDHGLITAKAVELYAGCADSAMARAAQRHRRRVEQGARDEDVTPIFRRMTNWHFFRENTLLAPRKNMFCTVHPTSEAVFAWHVAALRRLPPLSEDAWPRLGRIIHHIQDMSTPAHVTPVYHDMRIQDSFERHASPRVPQALRDMMCPADMAAVLRARAAMSLEELYEDAARRTLARLFQGPGWTASVNGRPETATWDWFWERHHVRTPYSTGDAHTSFPGFGRYGTPGLRFGDTAFQAGADELHIPESVYRELLAVVVEKAVFDTMAALAIVDRAWSRQ